MGNRTVEATLNGLKLTFDETTGNLLAVSYGSGVGEVATEFLSSSAEAGSLLDLAYPIAAFEPLRLASRFSKGARIEVKPDSVTVFWEALGPSRDFAPKAT